MAGRLRFRTVRDVLALLLAVTLVGAVVVGAVGSDRSATAATTTTHRLVIPAAAFRPIQPNFWYVNQGNYLRGEGWFTAPVPFYMPGNNVQVVNIALLAEDNHPGQTCATLIRAIPAQGTQEQMVQVCSDGASPGVRAFQERVASPRGISAFQAGYIYLELFPDTLDLRVYGVRITYQVTE